MLNSAATVGTSLRDLVEKVRTKSPEFSQVIREFDTSLPERLQHGISTVTDLFPVIKSRSATQAYEKSGIDRDHVGRALAVTMSQEARALLNFIETVITNNREIGIRLQRPESDFLGTAAMGIESDISRFRTCDGYSFEKLEHKVGAQGSMKETTTYSVITPHGEQLGFTVPDKDQVALVTNSKQGFKPMLVVRSRSIDSLAKADVEVVQKNRQRSVKV